MAHVTVDGVRMRVGVDCYAFTFYIRPAPLGTGGLCVAPKPGVRKRLPVTDDVELAVTAAIMWLEETEPGAPYDRAMVHRRGEHPVWVRANGDRFQRGPDEPLELWGSVGRG